MSPRFISNLLLLLAGAATVVCSRWFSAGSALPYAEDRFVRVGEYHGFPVYRQRNGPSNEIWVPAVEDGPLAPYRR